MTKALELSYDFLHDEDVMPVEGDSTDWISPAVYDIPTELDVSTAGSGDVVVQFVYPDDEEASPETALEGSPDVIARLGRFSGKLLSARFPVSILPSVADRIQAASRKQRRKHIELNFRLLSNILRKKQDDLRPL